jgi:hypothetical protein
MSDAGNIILPSRVRADVIHSWCASVIRLLRAARSSGRVGPAFRDHDLVKRITFLCFATCRG